MDIGLIVPFLIGSIIVFFGIYSIVNRDWMKKDIKKWALEPKTIARITEKQNTKNEDGEYSGTIYIANIFINGEWYKAKSKDRFFGKSPCEIGDEVNVAYKPITSNATTDLLMNTMTESLLGKKWDERKPTFWFKFLDTKMYDNEKKKGIGTSIFFICFGLVIILMSYLACLGII